MKILSPSRLCLFVPALLAAIYIVIAALCSLPEGFVERRFPLNVFLILQIGLLFFLGMVIPVLAMLWGAVCCFIKVDERRQVGASLMLVVVSFFSVIVFGSFISRLENFPIPLNKRMNISGSRNPNLTEPSESPNTCRCSWSRPLAENISCVT